MLELRNVKCPGDIRTLSVNQLEQLARQIREKIIQDVSKTGGHIGPSLGTVELTLALHTAFDTPRDLVVWDVGHQTYAHKLITGRYDTFHTLRTLGGISGFPKRSEAPYDVYDTGHAGGSISFALGLAKSRDLKSQNHNIVAVIGDGALTSGIAYEGLTNVGKLGSPLIVVLNDNSMSISKNVGGIAEYLTLLRLAPTYRAAKVAIERTLDHMPNVGSSAISLLRRFKGSFKHFLLPESWFEALGFKYYGPIDGHDIYNLQKVFEEVKTLKKPVFIHVITKKGKGYLFAEKYPEKFHGPGPFNVETGQSLKTPKTFTYSQVFGKALSKFAENNPKIAVISAAMIDGTGLSDFARRFPDRLFDVGIAEGHAVTFAAGLAQGGMIPVVSIYSTFLQRAYDQIVEDVCLQGLKVIFAIDRAGLVGEDGETHHGQFDISYLRHIPGLTIMAPKDEVELVNMLWTALHTENACAIRYPRGEAIGISVDDAIDKPKLLEIGEPETISIGRHINILALGSMVYPAIETAQMLSSQGISAGVINARFVVPFAQSSLKNLIQKTPLLIIEENVESGGFGELITSIAGTECSKIYKVALPNKFIRHGTQTKLRAMNKLDAFSIASRVKKILA